MNRMNADFGRRTSCFQSAFIGGQFICCAFFDYNPALASSTVGKNENTVSSLVTRKESLTAPVAPAIRIFPLTFMSRL
jgi:hypothetical protein